MPIAGFSNLAPTRPRSSSHSSWRWELTRRALHPRPLSPHNTKSLQVQPTPQYLLSKREPVNVLIKFVIIIAIDQETVSQIICYMYFHDTHVMVLVEFHRWKKRASWIMPQWANGLLKIWNSHLENRPVHFKFVLGEQNEASFNEYLQHIPPHLQAVKWRENKCLFHLQRANQLYQIQINSLCTMKMWN